MRKVNAFIMPSPCCELLSWPHRNGLVIIKKYKIQTMLFFEKLLMKITNYYCQFIKTLLFFFCHYINMWILSIFFLYEYFHSILNINYLFIYDVNQMFCIAAGNFKATFFFVTFFLFIFILFLVSFSTIICHKKKLYGSW